MFRRNLSPLQVSVGRREAIDAGPLAGVVACHAGLPAGAYAARVTPIELVDAPDGGAGTAKPPEWIDVLPVGRFTLDDGRGEFANDDPEAVIRASLGRGIDLVIDFDHATVYAPKGTQIPAAGWIKELAVREGKIRARVEWTERGALAVARREWRYISPVFIAGQDRKVTRLWHASLTNDPAIAMRAIAASREGTNMDEVLKLLAALLGLPETATEAEVLAAAKKAKPGAAAAAGGGDGAVAIASAVALATAPIAKALGLAETAKPDEVAAAAAAAYAAAAKPDPAKFAPIAVVTELTQRVAALEGAAASAAALAEVDAAIAAGKLIPAQRDWGLDYATRDLAAFKAFVAKQPAILAGGRVVTEKHAGDGVLTPEEKVVCRNLGLTEAAYLATKKSETKEAA